jgi:hypothetical protein
MHGQLEDADSRRMRAYEYLRIDDVERRADVSAPHIRAIPAPAAQTFRQAAEITRCVPR